LFYTSVAQTPRDLCGFHHGFCAGLAGFVHYGLLVPIVI
jgi:hypothetical protein